VRIAGERAWLTVKGTASALARPEFEYEIPSAEARDMLDLFCPKARLTKTRYRVPHDGLVWEVDVFEGHAQGLVLAEVELSHPDQSVTVPPWAGQEVTRDPRYRNAAIVSQVP
jgi:adenylate cyclase